MLLSGSHGVENALLKSDWCTDVSLTLMSS